MDEKPTMCVGIDVNHPRSHDEGNSYAAVVGSLDDKCAKYFSIVEEQSKGRLEGVAASLEAKVTTTRTAAQHRVAAARRIASLPRDCRRACIACLAALPPRIASLPRRAAATHRLAAPPRCRRATRRREDAAPRALPRR